jgi:hypothetical protein
MLFKNQEAKALEQKVKNSINHQEGCLQNAILWEAVDQ